MPFHLGPLELGIVLVIILMVFGVGRLPMVGAQLGKGLKALRNEMNVDTDNSNQEND